MNEGSDEHGGNSLVISQLDVISCGLGGAILLGLVFSVVRTPSPVDTSSPEYIAVEWFASDVNAQFNLIVQPPDGPETELSHDEWFDPRSGGVRVEKQETFPLREYGVFQIIDYHKRKKVTGDVFESFTLFIGAPAEGDWRINVRYADQPEDQWPEHLDRGDAIPELNVGRRFETRNSKRQPGPVMMDVPVRFGWSTNQPSPRSTRKDYFTLVSAKGQ